MRSTTSGPRLTLIGRIGSAIAVRLSAFGCVISYRNRREVEPMPVAR
jgi:lactate dehydrogenase-like 2-hydroxyacid dehydrogenase